MELEKIARGVSEAFGLLHQVKLGALRSYIKTTPEEQLVGEMKLITSSRYLRILWEAGLNARLQQVVLEQLEKIS